MRVWRRGILLAVVLTCAGACALTRRTPHIRYYVLTVPGTPPALAAPVRVGTFTADQAYATPRLAYRTSPYSIDYYIYHRWAADPRQLVASATRDYLERGAGRDGGPPFVIEGNVRRLEEVDEANGRQGAIALDVRVERDGQVVLDRSYVEVEPADGKNPEAVTAALSRALGRILNQVAGDLAASDGH